MINILKFQDTLHIPLLETILQKPFHSSHNSGLYQRISKSNLLGFVASGSGARWCTSCNLLHAMVETVRLGDLGDSLQPWCAFLSFWGVI